MDRVGINRSWTHIGNSSYTFQVGGTGLITGRLRADRFWTGSDNVGVGDSTGVALTTGTSNTMAGP